jgi:hypothetical protein
MSGWIGPQLFWTMLSCGKGLCGAHVEDDKIRGTWRTRELLPNTCVRMILCQATRCGLSRQEEVEAFFKLLKALEEPLNEQIELTLLAFVTQLRAIKSKYFFSNNFYNDLVKLINDIKIKHYSYALAPDVTYGTTQGAVWSNF